MLTSIGITASIYPQVKEVPKGNLSGIKDAVNTLLKFEAKPTVSLTLNDESKIEVETLMVTITNVPLIAAKNVIAPDALMDDGLLDIAVYPGFSKGKLLSYFAQTAHEHQVPDGSIQRYQARKIKIKTSPKLDIAGEGMILGKGTASIEVLPGALRVIAPESETNIKTPSEKITEKLPEPLSAVSQ
jgi:diacylglycerol kinase family enzyme